MKELSSLAWKEWHECRAFLWIALGVFLGLPMIGGVEYMAQFHRPYSISAVPWVMAFGAILAVFVAVGATCRDFSGGLENFWRSRPVTVWQWLLVKYAMGFGIVVVACMTPMGVQALVNREMLSAEWVFFPIELLVPYSLGFLAGCLFRRTAHAATLALAALLVLYLLPYVVPALHWFNATEFDSWKMSILWILAILVFSNLAEGAATVAVVYGWRVEAGRKVMFGAIGLAVVILFWSATYQLGTNLPVLQTAFLKPGENITWIRYNGNRGYVVTQRIYTTGTERKWQSEYRARSLEITPDGIKLGEETETNDETTGTWRWGASPPVHPDISYIFDWGPDPAAQNYICRLKIVALGKSIPPLTLWENPIPENQSRYSEEWGVTYIYKDRLYVMGSKMAALDISDPLSPRILSISPKIFSFNPWPLEAYHTGYDVDRPIIMELQPIPGLPAQQRLEAALAWACESGSACFDGSLLCEMMGHDGEYFGVARLTKLTEKAATFQRVGESSTTILQSIFGTSSYSRLQMQNGLLYMTSQAHFLGNQSIQAGAELNPCINVFDVKGPGAPKLVGHFAAPGVSTVCPLPDGRAIVGGSQLWLVGPPPRREGH